MTDVNELLIEPLNKFLKDSSYLVKKCTKPDHKGGPSLPYSCLILIDNILILFNTQSLLGSLEQQA